MEPGVLSFCFLAQWVVGWGCASQALSPEHWDQALHWPETLSVGLWRGQEGQLPDIHSQPLVLSPPQPLLQINFSS